MENEFLKIVALMTGVQRAIRRAVCAGRHHRKRPPTPILATAPEWEFR
ncbi:hypothetical protein [Pseudonocardia nigra]|nr:hypothetical protein [Pseudonocardia nigra]